MCDSNFPIFATSPSPPIQSTQRKRRFQIGSLFCLTSKAGKGEQGVLGVELRLQEITRLSSLARDFYPSQLILNYISIKTRCPAVKYNFMKFLKTVKRRSLWGWFECSVSTFADVLKSYRNRFLYDCIT